MEYYKNNQVEKIIEYGVRNLEITKPYIYFTEDIKFLNTNIASMFLPNENTILVNTCWLRQVSFTEIIITILHEIRHTYQ